MNGGVLRLAYQGFNFIFDGTPSQMHGLRICSFESTGYRYVGGSSMTATTDKASRSLRSYFLGVVPEETLEFDLEVVCERTMNDLQAANIKSWLFGHIKPKQLRILSPELSDVYFNCILNNPEDIFINGNNGWKFTVMCDAGGAWENPKTKRYYPTASKPSIVVSNLSGNNDYTYPSFSFKLASGATEFSVTNRNDNDRVTAFSGLVGGEVITVDGETKTVSSSSGLNRLSNFKSSDGTNAKNYLRLIRGNNTLLCSGNVEYVDITIQNFRRLGG